MRKDNKTENRIESTPGFMYLLHSYLDSMEKILGKLPSYYPDHWRIGEYSERDILKKSQSSEIDKSKISTYRIETEKDKAFEWDEKSGNLKENRRLIILGDPGFGKTFLLRSEGLSILREAKQILEISNNIDVMAIPIYVRLADIASYFSMNSNENRPDEKVQEWAVKNKSHSFAEAIIDYILRNYCKFFDKQEQKIDKKHKESFENFIRNKLNTYKCAIFLDGLDRVPISIGKTLREVIYDFSVKHPSPKIFLSSRTTGYSTPPPVYNARELELIPYKRSRVEKFINRWFTYKLKELEEMTYEKKLLKYNEAWRKVDDIIKNFDLQPSLMRMCKIPLFLSYVCKLKYDEPEKFITNRSTIYHRILLGLLWDWKKDKSKSEKIRTEAYSLISDKIKILEYIAWFMFQRKMETCSQGQLLEYINKAKTEIDYMPDLSNKDSLSILEEFNRDGILVRSGSFPDSPYLFLNFMVREYLAASFIARHNLLPVKIEGTDDYKYLKRDEEPDKLIFNCTEWEPIIVLLSGFIKGDSQSPSIIRGPVDRDISFNPLELIKVILDLAKQQDEDCRLLNLAAECMGEYSSLGKISLHFTMLQRRLIYELLDRIREKDEDTYLKIKECFLLSGIRNRDLLTALLKTIKFENEEYVRERAIDILSCRSSLPDRTIRKISLRTYQQAMDYLKGRFTGNLKVTVGSSKVKKSSSPEDIKKQIKEITDGLKSDDWFEELMSLKSLKNIGYFSVKKVDISLKNVIKILSEKLMKKKAPVYLSKRYRDSGQVMQLFH